MITEKLLTDFIADYETRYDYYEAASRICHEQLEKLAIANGIRSIVTHRAKSSESLENKVREKSRKKTYRRIDKIYDDICDLAGVRLALFFPADRDSIDELINKNFNVLLEKRFPDQSTFNIPDYKKRFSGYWATHYRLNLKPSLISAENKKYVSALIEVQVASVLMLAWAEVEHDLIYKPSSGMISEDEYKIIDQLNGMVLEGEIALELLQKAIDIRLKVGTTSFSNQYELAAYLVPKAKEMKLRIGRVLTLYHLLKVINLDTPNSFDPYIPDMPNNRPLADQILDRLIAENPSYSDKYASILAQREKKRESDEVLREYERLLGRFLRTWVALENILERIIESRGLAVIKTRLFSPSYLHSLDIFPERIIKNINRIRLFRNKLVHSLVKPEDYIINGYLGELQELLSVLEKENHSA